jgi:MFS family permease
MAFVIRLTQGFGSACVQVAVFSIVAIQFPKEKVVYFGYCESATGIGLMAGPIVGQAFYSAFGFEGCFFSTTVVLAFAGFLSWLLIPDIINAHRQRKVNSGGKNGTFKQLALADE